MTPVAEVRGLVCGYGDRAVLNGIELSIAQGERVALLGPNGSGKSTLIRAISGILKPQRGEVLLQGEPISRFSAREIAQRVAVAPQEETARFEFTVRDVVTMGRLARSNGLFDTPEDREAASAAMDRADCRYLEDRRVTDLSGGERQRVLIARALAQATPLVLLDEPTSHLDPAHQLGVAESVQTLSRDGIATVAAIHDLNLASRIATRAILLENGKVGMDDAVEAALNSPILDRVYGVRFERIRTPEGRLIVLPAN